MRGQPQALLASAEAVELQHIERRINQERRLHALNEAYLIQIIMEQIQLTSAHG
jgi:hypothetical protein